MAERDPQIQRDVDVDSSLDGTLDEQAEHEPRSTDSERDTGFVRKRVGSVVSGSGLAAGVGLAVLGYLLVGLVPFVPVTISSLLGVFLGTFLLGMVASSRQYAESALAGVLVGGGAVLWAYFPWSVFGASTTMLSFGIVGGALAGIAGQYFGRDLKVGMTRDIEHDSDGF